MTTVVLGAALAVAACAPTGAPDAALDGRSDQAAGSAAARAAVVQSAARSFLSRYVDPDGRVVRRDQGGDTVSEGVSYALLLAQVAEQELQAHHPRNQHRRRALVQGRLPCLAGIRHLVRDHQDQGLPTHLPLPVQEALLLAQHGLLGSRAQHERAPRVRLSERLLLQRSPLPARPCCPSLDRLQYCRRQRYCQ